MSMYVLHAVSAGSIPQTGAVDFNPHTVNLQGLKQSRSTELGSISHMKPLKVSCRQTP